MNRQILAMATEMGIPVFHIDVSTQEATHMNDSLIIDSWTYGNGFQITVREHAGGTWSYEIDGDEGEFTEYRQGFEGRLTASWAAEMSCDEYTEGSEL